MGIVKSPEPVKLIVGLLFARNDLLQQAKEKLAEQYGPVDFISEELPFTYTHYYDAEIGVPIRRQFISFANLIDPGDLARIKNRTNEIEQIYAESGHRPINLDPGYITAAKLVLATTKDNAHRIYIGEGIYAEITLQYKDRQLNPLQWTYPDYCAPETLAIFTAIRHLFLAQRSPKGS